MKYFDEEGALIIKCWSDNPEEIAINQARNLARLPFAFRQVCLMPDTHCGYGMPIGGVLATKGVVIPNAVGVDIGCGMIAVKTSLNDICQESLKRVLGGSKGYHGGIRSSIPVGMKHHSKKQEERWMPESDNIRYETHPIVAKEYTSALKQIGTLGGGK